MRLVCFVENVYYTSPSVSPKWRLIAQINILLGYKQTCSTKSLAHLATSALVNGQLFNIFAFQIGHSNSI